MTTEAAATLFLHIGIEKTGTSTIQHVFSHNRALLQQGGLLFPQLSVGTNHFVTSYFATGRGDRPPKLPIHGVTQAAADAFRDQMVPELQRTVAESGCAKVLISNELLSSRLRNKDSAASLIEALRQVAGDVRVIVYLRPQYEIVSSRYAGLVKRGLARKLEAPRTADGYDFNYDKMLQVWEAAAGADSIIVRRYARSHFVNGDVLTDFFAAMAVQPPEGLETGRTVNRGLDADLVEFLRIANQIMPRLKDAPNAAERATLLQALEKLSTERTVPGLPETLAAVDQLFAESNSEVARRYFPESGGVLFAPYSPTGKERDVILDTERAVELALLLWRQAYNKVAGPAGVAGRKRRKKARLANLRRAGA